MWGAKKERIKEKNKRKKRKGKKKEDDVKQSIQQYAESLLGSHSTRKGATHAGAQGEVALSSSHNEVSRSVIMILFPVISVYRYGSATVALLCTCITFHSHLFNLNCCVILICVVIYIITSCQFSTQSILHHHA